MYPSLDIDFNEEFASAHSPRTLARLVNPEMVRKSVAIIQRRNLDVNITAWKSHKNCVSPRYEPIEDIGAIASFVQSFAEWEFLSRDNRRKLLKLLRLEIAVDRYKVESLAVNLGVGSNIVTKTAIRRWSTW